MWPTVIKIPVLGIPINSYGIAIMIGFLLAVWVWLTRVKKCGYDIDFALDVSIVVMITGLIGGKIASIVTNFDQYKNELGVFNIFDGKLDPLGSLLGLLPVVVFLVLSRKKQVDFWSRLKIVSLWTFLCVLVGMRALYVVRNSTEFSTDFFRKWQAGFALYGGLILGMICGILYAKYRKQPALKLLDVAAPAIILGLAFGRLGCFASGCCFGKPCEKIWCVSFPKGDMPGGSPVYQRHKAQGLITDSDTASKPVHPTQIYETIACLAAFFVLSYIWKRKKFDGQVITSMGIFYSSWRFLNEFLRDDPERMRASIFGLTWPQEVSILVFIFAWIMYFFFQARDRRLKSQTETTPQQQISG